MVNSIPEPVMNQELFFQWYGEAQLEIRLLKLEIIKYKQQLEESNKEGD